MRTNLLQGISEVRLTSSAGKLTWHLIYLQSILSLHVSAGMPVLKAACFRGRLKEIIRDPSLSITPVSPSPSSPHNLRRLSHNCTRTSSGHSMLVKFVESATSVWLPRRPNPGSNQADIVSRSLQLLPWQSRIVT